jgi:hypothetical protein
MFFFGNGSASPSPLWGRLGWGALQRNELKQARVFFSEEKKQKTFGLRSFGTWQTGSRRMCGLLATHRIPRSPRSTLPALRAHKNHKSFLLLFFKKEVLA